MGLHVIDELIIFKMHGDASHRWNNHCSDVVAHLEILFVEAISRFIKHLVTMDVIAIGVKFYLFQLRGILLVWKGFQKLLKVLIAVESIRVCFSHLLANTKVPRIFHF